MVNLTTLAPDIVAATLDETLPPDVTVFELQLPRRRSGRSSGRGLTSRCAPSSRSRNLCRTLSFFNTF